MLNIQSVAINHNVSKLWSKIALLVKIEKAEVWYSTHSRTITKKCRKSVTVREYFRLVLFLSVFFSKICKKKIAKCNSPGVSIGHRFFWQNFIQRKEPKIIYKYDYTGIDKCFPCWPIQRQCESKQKTKFSEFTICNYFVTG